MNNETQYDSDGAVFNGFDYRLQVWVVGGVVKMCGHSDNLEFGHGRGCNGARYATRAVKYIDGHEVICAN